MGFKGRVKMSLLSPKYKKGQITESNFIAWVFFVAIAAVIVAVTHF